MEEFWEMNQEIQQKKEKYKPQGSWGSFHLQNWMNSKKKKKIHFFFYSL